MSKDKFMTDTSNTFSCPRAVEGGTCKSKFQDDRYGKGKRVFTPVAEKTAGTKRCTVCNITI